MAGYVVESLLKAHILKRFGLASLPRRYWHHDLNVLLDAAGLRLTLKQSHMAILRTRFELLRREWDVTMRYGGARHRRNDAERVLIAVEALKKWLTKLN